MKLVGMPSPFDLLLHPDIFGNVLSNPPLFRARYIHKDLRRRRAVWIGFSPQLNCFHYTCVRLKVSTARALTRPLRVSHVFDLVEELFPDPTLPGFLHFNPTRKTYRFRFDPGPSTCSLNWDVSTFALPATILVSEPTVFPFPALPGAIPVSFLSFPTL